MSSVSRVMTTEKHNNIVSSLTSGRDAPCPEGLHGWRNNSYRRRSRYIDDSYYSEDGQLFLRKKEGSKEFVMRQTVLDVVDKAHASLAHAGILKALNEILGDPYSITRKNVQWLLGKCSSCWPHRAESNRAPAYPIRSRAQVERVFFDFVDLRCDTSESHKWFLYVKDHFTKLSKLYPLDSTKAQGTARCLEEFIRLWGLQKSYIATTICASCC